MMAQNDLSLAKYKKYEQLLTAQAFVNYAVP